MPTDEPLDYKKGYLTLFGEITRLLALLEALDPTSEGINLPQALRQIQQQGEGACIQ